MREPRSSPQGGCDRLLVLVVLAFGLGFGAVGAGILAPTAAVESASPASGYPRATSAPPAAATESGDGARFQSRLVCSTVVLRASPRRTADLASIDDPRTFLTKMTALQRRRHVGWIGAPGPFQTSLNPATAITIDGSP